MQIQKGFEAFECKLEPFERSLTIRQAFKAFECQFEAFK